MLFCILALGRYQNQSASTSLTPILPKKIWKNVENRISTLSVARIQVDAIGLLTAFVNVLSVTVKVAREKESGGTKKRLISWENEQEEQNFPEQFDTTKFWIGLQIALRIDSELVLRDVSLRFYNLVVSFNMYSVIVGFLTTIIVFSALWRNSDSMIRF